MEKTDWYICFLYSKKHHKGGTKDMKPVNVLKEKRGKEERKET